MPTQSYRPGLSEAANTRHEALANCKDPRGEMTLAQAPFAQRKIEVREAGEAELERAWDDYVYRHNSASPFHLTAWKRVI